MQKRTPLVLVVVCLFCFGLSNRLWSENKKADLQFGMSAAFSGPAADLGINMRDGILAAFHEANEAGGVNGQQLKLVSLNDGYEPKRTAPNMRKLVENKEILAIIGNVGTPTAIAAIPIVKREGIPFFGAYTGAGVLRQSPPNRYLINYRASYAQETGAMVTALIKSGLKVHEIAFFTQRDGYGDAGYVGGIAAMKKFGLEKGHKVIHSRYERNTLAVEDALADLIAADVEPKAVIMVGSYAPCAELIKLAQEYSFNPVFLNVSFVGSASLAKKLGEDSKAKVVITQVVPHYNSEEKIVKQYQSALRAAGVSDSSFGSLEGYVAARIMLKALAKIKGSITRESIVDALESLGDFDLGLGVKLKLSKSHHQACQKVWQTRIVNGKVTPFAWNHLKKLLKE